MDKFQRLKNLLRFLDATISPTLFAVISVFGLFGIYLFLVKPAIYYLSIDYADVVFGSGILPLVYWQFLQPFKRPKLPLGSPWQPFPHGFYCMASHSTYPGISGQIFVARSHLLLLVYS